jgi:glycosyltransferase involved in cell wall biosynthesis
MTLSISLSDEPLITFALIAYNQEQFIAEAAQGAFSQTYSPLEVIISDDCSSDRTFEIMQEMAAVYQGAHTIVLNRNERNLGLIGNINRVMEIVQGELIVIAAGDDISLPERTEKLYQSYAASQRQAHSLFSRAIRIDSEGNQLGTEEISYSPNRFDLEYMAEHQISVPGSTQAWSRKIFDTFGPIDTRLISEDVIIPFRAALLGKIAFVDQPLIYRRHHQNNMWLHPKKADSSEITQWHRQQFAHRLDNMLGIWETKARDLDLAMIRFPERKKELDSIRSILQQRLADIKIEQQYFQARPVQRISILLNSLRKGISPVRLMRWILQYTLPGYYYKIARLYG